MTESCFEKTVNSTDKIYLYYILYLAGWFLSAFAAITSYINNKAISYSIMLNTFMSIVFLTSAFVVKRHKEYRKIMSKITLYIVGFIYFPLACLVAHHPFLTISYQYLLPLLYIVLDVGTFDLILANLIVLYFCNLAFGYIKIPHDFVSLFVMSTAAFLIELLTTILIKSIITKLRLTLQETESLKETYKKLSRTDPLTGLNNRLGVKESLAPFSNKNCYIAMVDIDHFKEVNDTWGHEYGDQVLIQLANILRNYAKSKFLYVGRIGGEEFIIVSYYKSQKTFVDICESLRKEVEAKVILKDGRSSTVSIGISDNDIYSEQLQEQADKRLYYSKSQGRNRITTKIILSE